MKVRKIVPIIVKASWTVAKRKPEKDQACVEFEPVTSAMPLQCSNKPAGSWSFCWLNKLSFGCCLSSVYNRDHLPHLQSSYCYPYLYFVSRPQTVKLVDSCQWSDSLVELQMWSRLSVLAFNAENHSLVLHCGQRAVAFAESDRCLAKRSPKKPDRWCDFLKCRAVLTAF